MAIHTQESVSGFIASDPEITYSARGVARFYVRVGQEHFRKESDGSFTQLDSTFHNLVVFNRSAERAAQQFRKGDNFVAEGYTRPTSYERDGQTIEDEEFVAKKIGHDTARTRYQVTRTRTPPGAAVEAPGVGQQREGVPPEFAQPPWAAQGRPTRGRSM